jgi:tetratricopeptide (TPR) repeat protein
MYSVALQNMLLKKSLEINKDIVSLKKYTEYTLPKELKTMEPVLFNAKEYYSRAISKVKSKNYKGAVEDFNSAIVVNPDYPEAIAERNRIIALLKEEEGSLKLEDTKIGTINQEGAKDDGIVAPPDFISSNNSQAFDLNTKIFKNELIGVEFKYPVNWEIGTPAISNTYWVGLPNYKSKGNVVLKVVPWKNKADFKNYQKDQYKKDILSTSIYYKDIAFIEFNNQIKISGIDGIYSYYKGFGKYVNSTYYELLIQWWKNDLLYTLQGQFNEPSLTKKQLEDFEKLIISIKL